MHKINIIYDHMDKIFLIMLDRSMCFSPAYEAIISNNMLQLTTQNPSLIGKEKELEQPLTIAFGYAQIIFLCMAIELCLLQHYVNSVGLFLGLKRGTYDALTSLRKWVESRKNVKTWERWLQLNPTQQMKILKEMSFSNLSTSQEFFSDIYGEDCFKCALSTEGYSSLQIAYQELQEKRNGILHRGGEFKDGRCIDVSAPDISLTYDFSKTVRDHVLRLSTWCREWWMTETGRHEIKPFFVSQEKED